MRVFEIGIFLLAIFVARSSAFENRRPSPPPEYMIGIDAGDDTRSGGDWPSGYRKARLRDIRTSQFIDFVNAGLLRRDPSTVHIQPDTLFIVVEDGFLSQGGDTTQPAPWSLCFSSTGRTSTFNDGGLQLAVWPCGTGELCLTRLNQEFVEATIVLDTVGGDGCVTGSFKDARTFLTIFKRINVDTPTYTTAQPTPPPTPRPTPSVTPPSSIPTTPFVPTPASVLPGYVLVNSANSDAYDRVTLSELQCQNFVDYANAEFLIVADESPPESYYMSTSDGLLAMPSSTNTSLLLPWASVCDQKLSGGSTAVVPGVGNCDELFKCNAWSFDMLANTVALDVDAIITNTSLDCFPIATNATSFEIVHVPGTPFVCADTTVE